MMRGFWTGVFATLGGVVGGFLIGKMLKKKEDLPIQIDKPTTVVKDITPKEVAVVPQGKWDETHSNYTDPKKRVWVRDLTADGTVAQYSTTPLDGTASSRITISGPASAGADTFAVKMDAAA
jgi:hypothetical protein